MGRDPAMKDVVPGADGLPEDLRARFDARRATQDARLSIGRYLIIGELGRGGMGVVYDAWDTRIERRVAIKTVEPDLVPDEQEREEVIERFIREIKIVGQLQHPGIITIYDYGEEPELRRGDDPYSPGRTYFYVMEYLEGRSLAALLREKKVLPDLDAVRIVIEVADALDIAHNRDVIHRDIKPSNIFVRTDGSIVLLDFGIAKTSSPALTRQGQILGTPTYLAPERLREKEVPLDGRADLFSLGVLLYTMLAGKAPFEGQNVYDLIDKIAKQEHAKLSRTTEAGQALGEVLDRLLAKQPSDRYADAEQAARALRGVKSLLEDAESTMDLPRRIRASENAETELSSPNLPQKRQDSGRTTTPDDGPMLKRSEEAPLPEAASVPPPPKPADEPSMRALKAPSTPDVPVRIIRAAAQEHSERVTELQETLGPPTPTPKPRTASRRRRIEASLVDEEDVVLDVAPTDEGLEEIPTKLGLPDEPQQVPAGVQHFATEQVRPRRAGSSRPRRAQPQTNVIDEADLGRRKKSAAVARRTFGVDVFSRERGRGKERRPLKVKVSGTDLDRQKDWQRVMRKRLAIFAGAALMAMGAGVFLGRRSRPIEPIQPIAPIDAPQVKAFPGEATPGSKLKVISPPTAHELFEQASLAFDRGDTEVALESYGLAKNAAIGVDLKAQAALGIAKSQRKLGHDDDAIDAYEEVLSLVSSGREAEEARAALSKLGPRKRPAPETPRRTHTPRTRSPKALEPATQAPLSSDALGSGHDPKTECRSLAFQSLSDPSAGAKIAALAEKHGEPECFYHLGGVYERASSSAKAIKAYERFLKLDPKSGKADAVRKKIAKLRRR